MELATIRAYREESQASYDWVSRLVLGTPDPTFRPTGRDPGTVRFKVTHEVADILDLEIDDTRGIKRRLEDILFRLYSNIGALRHPDKVGIAWGASELRSTSICPRECVPGGSKSGAREI